MLAGRGLYDYSLNMFGRQFPFDYPPFAALVPLPFALLPFALLPLYLMLVGARTWSIVGLAMVVAFAYWSPLAIPVEAALVWQEVSQYLMTLVMASIAVWELPAPRPLVTTTGPSDVA